MQLQPISDRFKQYDDEGQVTYNWGYDVQNYSAPETSFSTDPSNGNKPWKSSNNDPGLSWGRNFCGLGCGLQSYLFDRTWSFPKYSARIIITGWSQMVVSKMGQVLGMKRLVSMKCTRKYMIDSLTHWVKEYQIDGFRFDLMGIHDVRTMNAIREAMDALDPSHFLYGEGWDMGTGLAPEDKLRKTMQRNCLELDSSMIRSAMPLKGLRFMVPSNVALSAENQQRISLRVLF